jgi:hypothetical protein
MMVNYLEGLERHKSALSSSAIDIPVQSAEYALLGPELEHLAKQSVAGLLEEGGYRCCPI